MSDYPIFEHVDEGSVEALEEAGITPELLEEFPVDEQWSLTDALALADSDIDLPRFLDFLLDAPVDGPFSVAQVLKLTSVDLEEVDLPERDEPWGTAEFVDEVLDN